MHLREYNIAAPGVAALRFLREHVVSAVDRQAAAVWATPTPAGRPLFADALDLQRPGVTLLASLRQAAATARQGWTWAMGTR